MILADPAPAPGSAALAAAKAYLRIDGADEDALLGDLLASATRLGERFTNQCFLARDVSEALPVARAWRRLALTPVRGIATVNALAGDGTETTLAVESHAIDIDANGDGWVRVTGVAPSSRIAVGYAVGLAESWDGLPEPLRQGVVRLAAHLYANRDAADDAGPPAAIAALWRPWRRMRLA